jgi:N-succinyldiaminopimelate aminotransferase
MGAESAAMLGLEPPQGSTFLWLDVAGRLDERGLQGLLEDLADNGVTAAPGPSFGPYPTHIRVCFTAAPPDKVRRGMERLAELL